MILREYNNVRLRLSHCSKLLEETDLALPPLNEKRLNTWFKNEAHRNEVQTIIGCSTLVPVSQTAAQALIPAKARPTVSLKSPIPIDVLVADEVAAQEADRCILDGNAGHERPTAVVTHDDEQLICQTQLHWHNYCMSCL